MSKFLAKLGDKLATRSAKKVTKNGCWWGCYREETPEELL